MCVRWGISRRFSEVSSERREGELSTGFVSKTIGIFSPAAPTAEYLACSFKGKKNHLVPKKALEISSAFG